MAFRRRESRNNYSSADAYRSLHNSADAFEFHDQDPSPPIPHHGRLSSSEEDTTVPPTPFSPNYNEMDERTALNPGAPTRPGRPVSAGDSDLEAAPLRPPRPFFLGNPRRDSSDRGSWSSTATLEPLSDSDVGSTESVPRLQSVHAPRRPTVRTTGQTATPAAARRSSNGQNVLVGGGSKAARAAQRYANSNRERSASGSQTSTSGSGDGKPPVPPPPPESLRTRNQHRRRSSTAADDNASVGHTTSNSLQGAGKTDTLSAEPNPFDTPTSSVYAPSGVNITPMGAPGPAQAQAQEVNDPAPTSAPVSMPMHAPAPTLVLTPKPTTNVLRKISSPKPAPHSPTIAASKPPPSAFPSFPFQSHPGNPDPGTPIPGVPRRSSLDSFKNIPSRPSSAQSNPTSIQHGGNVYASGYTVIPRMEDQSQVELERPNAAFMHEDEMRQMREGSATPPTPSSVPGIYRNSAAAAMASNGQLAGGGEFIWVFFDFCYSPSLWFYYCLVLL